MTRAGGLVLVIALGCSTVGFGQDEFLRGDWNNDGVVDALRELIDVGNFDCEDARDADDDGNLSGLTDGIYLLAWAFTGGAAPPAPGTTECGEDETDDDTWDCDTPPDPCPADEVVLEADADYTLSMGSEIGAVCGTVDIAITLDNTGDGLQGFSFGVCHDGDLVAVAEEDFSGLQINKGADVDDYGFSGPAFFGGDASEDGWHVGCLMSFNQLFGAGLAAAWDADEGLEVAVVTYDLLAPGTMDLEFCETHGDPEVPNRAYTDTENFKFTTEDGSLEIKGWDYALTDAATDYSKDSPSGSITVIASITENVDNPDYPNDTTGFVMRVSCNSTYLEPSAAALGSDLEDQDIEFTDTSLSSNAVVFTVTYDLLGETFFTLEGTEAAELTFDLAAGLAGAEDPIVTSLDFTDAGSSINQVTTEAGNYTTCVTGSTVTLTPLDAPLTPDFRRGDVDNSGLVEPLLDALELLSWGFQNGDAPECLAAVDTDGDDAATPLLDSIYLLAWGFTNGPAPPDPGPSDCGPDPDEDGPECESSDCE